MINLYDRFLFINYDTHIESENIVKWKRAMYFLIFEFSPSDYRTNGPHTVYENLVVWNLQATKNPINQRLTRLNVVGPDRLELSTNGLWVRTVIHKIDNKYNKLTNNSDAKSNKNKETLPNKNNFLICKKLQVFRLQNSFSKLFLYLM